MEEPVALARRVRELTQHAERLEAELSAAQKRVAAYEQFDESIQDALGAALRAAFDIREKAEADAARSRAEAEAERAGLQGEIARLAGERDALRAQIAAAQAFRELMGEPRPASPSAPAAAVAPEGEAAPSPPVAPTPASEAAPPAAPSVMASPEATASSPAIAEAHVPSADTADKDEPPKTEHAVRVSPVASFAHVARIERHMQTLPQVRVVYLRDLRDGVAALSAVLRSAMTASELGRTFERLTAPRLRVLSSSREGLELRVEDDAPTA